MNNASTVAHQYLAAWNEADDAARRVHVRQLFATNARYVDPMMQGSGHEGIETLIAGARQHFPGHRFELAGVPDGHNNVVRFSWTLRAPSGDSVAHGTDIAVVAGDGRLSSVTGFLDKA
ncbi:MAG: nuclear transport factor 2 family protein [Lysobacteraceae bacterium]|nr:MAG: nuclear transport factor 2 family protein [Xanthomonadaceae bacterium]